MKLTILLILISTLAFSQSKTLITGKNLALIPITGIPAQVVTGQAVKIATTTDVTLVPGLVGTINYPQDSSKLLNFIMSKGEQWKVTYTAEKIGGTTPPTPGALTVEAESATLFSGVTIEAGGTICCVQGGAFLKYTINFPTAKTKLTVRYSRGDAGNGTLYLRSGQAGPIVATLVFPFSGAWTTWKDAVFTIPSQVGTKDLWVTASLTGQANLDKYTFE